MKETKRYFLKNESKAFQNEIWVQTQYLAKICTFEEAEFAKQEIYLVKRPGEDIYGILTITTDHEIGRGTTTLDYSKSDVVKMFSNTLQAPQNAKDWTKHLLGK